MGDKRVALHYFAKITGLKQGTLRGDSHKPNRQKWIELSGFDLGQLARQHEPVIITQPSSASTPQLLQAWRTKESLSEVVVEGTNQGSETVASRVILTQGQIVHYAGAKNGDNAFTFIFQTIRDGLKVPSK